MKYIGFILLTFLSFQVSAQPVHTISWERGVYKQTLTKWLGALNKVANIDSKTYIRKKVGGEDKLHKKKHRDVIFWVPESTNLNKPFVMLVWFHGHYGYVEHRTFVDRTLKQLVPLAEQGKNFVLVLPEMPWSVHTSTPTKRNSRLWTNPGDFINFIDQSKKVLVEHNNNNPLSTIDYRIVGHSAGGSTIKRLGMTGDLCKIKPSMVVWSDSSYGPWLDLAWDGCLKEHSKIMVKVFVAKGDSPWRHSKRFMKRFKTLPENLKLYVMQKPRWSHKLIGNNIVELSEVLKE